MSKRKYVVNLGLSYERLSEDVLEDILNKANKFIEEGLSSRINIGRNLDFSTSILVSRDEVITFEIIVEIISPTPIPLEYEVVIDKTVDDAFKFIEHMLSEVDSNATT